MNNEPGQFVLPLFGERMISHVTYLSLILTLLF
jgi:hypothetical protein